MPGPTIEKNSLTITSGQVLELAVETLAKHLALPIDGYRCKAVDVLRILVAACAQRSTIESTTQHLKDGPSGNRVREQLNKALPQSLDELTELEAALNQALVEHLPPGIIGQRHQMAIDWVLVPYHGQPDRDEREIRRGRAKSGTTHFHVYATAYVIRKNKRVTLALTYVRADDTPLSVLQRLLQHLAQLQVGIRRLYLDRAYYSVAVIRFLQTQAFVSILPPIRRGQRMKQLLNTRKSYRTTYTLRSQQDGSVIFELWVVCRYLKGRRGKRGIERLPYVIIGELPWNPAGVRDGYRRRFGIESSHRQMNQLRARTSSRKPGVRLLLVGIAFVLRNLWVFIRWSWLGVPRRGGRWIDARRFTLNRLARFLSHAVEATYGTVSSVERPVARVPT